jgi:hypothetical protein
MSVPCRYPDRDDFDRDLPPGEFDEWKQGETCTHEYCIEAAQAFAAWPAERARRESRELAAQDGFVTDESILLGLK